MTAVVGLLRVALDLETASEARPVVARRVGMMSSDCTMLSNVNIFIEVEAVFDCCSCCIQRPTPVVSCFICAHLLQMN